MKDKFIIEESNPKVFFVKESSPHPFVVEERNPFTFFVKPVIGGDVTIPTLLSAILTDNFTLALTFNEALNESIIPDFIDFVYAQNVTGITISGAVVTLTFTTEILYSDTDQIAYIPGTNRLQDLAGNEVAAFSSDVDNSIFPNGSCSDLLLDSEDSDSFVASWINNSTDETAIIAEISEDETTWTETSLPAGTKNYTFEGLDASTLYYVKIHAEKNGYPSGDTLTESVTTESDIIEEFMITVDTTKAGSASNTFVLPTTGAGYDCSIDWGDSTTTSHSGTPGNITHVYPVSGIYQIKISGTFPRIYFNNAGDKLKLLTVHFGLNVFTSMQNAFYGCTNLTSLGTYPIQGATIAGSGFENFCFNCSSLVTIPVDIFRYCTNVSTRGFRVAFGGCTSLENLPPNLFKYNLACATTAFQQTFTGCNKLQLNRTIFYADGEQSTRFLNVSIGFTLCFNRTSFTGIQGEAPDLWNCNFGTGTPTKTDCFNGAGNSLTSISNYNDIPEEWI